MHNRITFVNNSKILSREQLRILKALPYKSLSRGCRRVYVLKETSLIGFVDITTRGRIAQIGYLDCDYVPYYEILLTKKLLRDGIKVPWGESLKNSMLPFLQFFFDRGFALTENASYMSRRHSAEPIRTKRQIEIYTGSFVSLDTSQRSAVFKLHCKYYSSNARKREIREMHIHNTGMFAYFLDRHTRALVGYTNFGWSVKGSRDIYIKWFVAPKSGYSCMSALMDHLESLTPKAVTISLIVSTIPKKAFQARMNLYYKFGFRVDFDFHDSTEITSCIAMFKTVN